MAILLRTLLGTGVVAVVMGVISPASYALSLGTYDFGTGAGTVTPSGIVPGTSFSNFTYTGTGTTNQPAGNGSGKAFSANGFSDDAIINTDFTGNPDGFFSFSVAPTSGNTVTIDGLKLDLKPNGNSAPANFLIRSSLDSFAADLFTSVLGPKNDWRSFNSTFGPLATTAPVTFRIYGFNTTTGNADNLDIDNVVVHLRKG
jgi:hypothetical protein